ncbi:protein argonaute-2-like isoform X1 [Artemia franciscana]|uniref:protein argonaute-2-like isoform X1 n=1 Tax=Artemia franciscana TaxID=6661 RepID=UPI0032DAFB03
MGGKGRGRGRGQHPQEQQDQRNGGGGGRGRGQWQGQQERPPGAQRQPGGQPQQSAWGAPQQQQPGAWGQGPQQAQSVQSGWGPRPAQPQGAPSAWGPRPTHQPQQQAPSIPGLPPQASPARSMGRGRETVTSAAASPASASPQKSAQQRPQEAKKEPGSEKNVYGRGVFQKQKEQFSSLQPCKRPDGGGTWGKTIKLRVNHFQLELQGTKKAYHYDVEINEKGKPMPNKELRRVTMRHVFSHDNFAEHFPKDCCVFDGMKSMYSCRKLKFREQAFPVNITFEERAREFEVVVKIAAEIDLNTITAYMQRGSSVDIPQEGIHCLDVVLRYHQTYNMQYVPVTRSLFSMNQPMLAELGDGAVVWLGHFQSVRMGTHMFLNVDASQKAFYKSDEVVNVMYDVLRLNHEFEPPHLTPEQVRIFDRYMRGVKVRFLVGAIKRDYKVNGLLSPANDTNAKFDSDGQLVTVEEYFKKHYNAELKYPYLHCLWVGSAQKQSRVPIECCTIKPGQVMRGKLNEMQTSEMIKAAAKPPFERKKRIDGAIQKMQGCGPVARNFGISMSNQMAQVDGRILEAPRVEVGGQNGVQLVTPRDGKWDMRNKKFLSAAALEHWGVLDVSRTKDMDIRKFFETLKKMARSFGMNVNDQCFNDSCRENARDVENALRQYQKMNNKLNFVFVIIPKKGAEIYQDIKYIGDLNLSITTQCIVKNNVFKCQDATIGNLLLKINSKLGGTNTYISTNPNHKKSLPNILKERVMILGADVSHPAPEFRVDNPKPSIAAVVGSIDAFGLKYRGEIRAQDPGREIIDEMEEIVVKLLLRYRESNPHTEPSRLIFFRDGVSEGQFQDVLKWEFNAIRKACRRMRPDYSPPITFIVVQKRHNTRFFAEPGEPTVGRGQNVPPGTVVDSLITHRQEFDFFICSHEGIQGTSRPTHYYVLFDENEFNSNDLQMLTYHMCHMYVRCSRSVSNPAPSYYAHLLAFRGRHHHDSMMRRGIQNPRQQTEMLENSSRTRPMFYV